MSAAPTWHGDDRLDLDALERELHAPRTAPDESWHAVLVALSWPTSGGDLRALCAAHAIRMVDTLERQLADLAFIRLPAPTSIRQRQTFVHDRLRDRGDPAGYGCWAWLPWIRTMVHVLPPDEYFEVVTNRNQNKLTREEQLVLRTRRIGVVGLSVGGEAAVTLAQEHLCGHMMLADFDRLDLSNLNRLGAGIDELAVNKAVIVARRIARIDPYLRLSLFADGVTDATMPAFLEGLDLLVEECDTLPLKFGIRRAAQARRIDVIYAGDERGFISVEPYASLPDLPLFHGLVASEPRPREAHPSPAAFMRDLTAWLGGWDRISERSRESLMRVGHDLAGYPQLASEARLAAGQLGHVARRLLLGERLPGSWQHMDLDQLILR